MHASDVLLGVGFPPSGFGCGLGAGLGVGPGSGRLGVLWTGLKFRNSMRFDMLLKPIFHPNCRPFCWDEVNWYMTPFGNCCCWVTWMFVTAPPWASTGKYPVPPVC